MKTLAICMGSSSPRLARSLAEEWVEHSETHRCNNRDVMRGLDPRSHLL
jgi:hypothetical protein